MKKLHPRFEVDETSDDDILIYSTARDDDAAAEEPEKPEDDGPVDPRWDILKKLNNN